MRAFLFARLPRGCGAPLSHVIAGLDPAIHLDDVLVASSFELDARVKPAHDAEFGSAFGAKRIRISNSPCACYQAHLRILATPLRPSGAGRSRPSRMRGGGAPHGAGVVVRGFVDRLAKAINFAARRLAARHRRRFWAIRSVLPGTGAGN
uniref:Uncharacterized protein n=1 Tax=Rhodopseudomonas palustris (strain BisA53) TaxID=316055 RepID=Q07QZ9_RHOP5